MFRVYFPDADETLIGEFQDVFSAYKAGAEFDEPFQVEDADTETIIVSWNLISKAWWNGWSPLTLLKISKAAYLLGVTERRVRQIYGRYGIGEKMNGKWYIILEQLQKYAENKKPIGRPKFT